MVRNYGALYKGRLVVVAPSKKEVMSLVKGYRPEFRKKMKIISAENLTLEE